MPDPSIEEVRGGRHEKSFDGQYWLVPVGLHVCPSHPLQTLLAPHSPNASVMHVGSAVKTVVRGPRRLSRVFVAAVDAPVVALMLATDEESGRSAFVVCSLWA